VVIEKDEKHRPPLSHLPFFEMRMNNKEKKRVKRAAIDLFMKIIEYVVDYRPSFCSPMTYSVDHTRPWYPPGEHACARSILSRECTAKRKNDIHKDGWNYQG
jgi:hypothetical protein